MSIPRDQTVPFGRSLREYELMFSLSAADRRRRILDCAGFTAELTVASSSACSLDPLYQFARAEIQRQFFQTLDQVIEQVRATPQKGNGPLYLRLSAIAAVRGESVRPRALIALCIPVLGSLLRSLPPGVHSSSLACRARGENLRVDCAACRTVTAPGSGL